VKEAAQAAVREAAMKPATEAVGRFVVAAAAVTVRIPAQVLKALKNTVPE
jgi:hypothetical protein